MNTEVELLKETEIIDNNIASSCSDTDIGSKKENEKTLKDKLFKEYPEAFEYIQRLENVIKKHLKKISKLRNKLKVKHKCIDNSTQTDFEATTNTILNTSVVEPNVETPKSLVDDIKEAAEIAMQKTGFVYEETSGLYYDYSTGYYYNAEYGLYYDGTTGKYLQYNAETQTYEFHSQVPVPTTQLDGEENSLTKRKKKQKPKNKGTKRSRNGEENTITNTDDLEEGECSTSDASGDDDGCDIDSDSSDIGRSWPPCMRIIIESSEIPSLKEGSLHIITCDGGTIGREGPHSILLKDPSASKHHLKITFDKKSGMYQAVDLGSRNGTLLNSKRMSSSKQESEVMDIVHGSKIQIGQTVLLCHIHEGNQTCGHCEPGLIQVKEQQEKMYKPTKSNRHKQELNNLKMLYGVSDYEGDRKLATGYKDRAQKRRETVGSQNPHEKTQMASVDESINKENKGFKLLEKMGWKEGQSLGKDGDGLLEPVNLKANVGTTGIGATNVDIQLIPSEVKKQNIWKKTNERFQKLPESNTAFDLSDD